MSYSVEDIEAPSPKADAWPTIPIGRTAEGRIEFVASRPYVKHDDPQYNPRNQSKATLKIIFGGRAIYPRTHLGPQNRKVSSLNETDQSGQPLLQPVPDNLMRAIAVAVKESGRRAIEEGGFLRVTRIEDRQTQFGMAHNFKVEYTPPPAGVNVDQFQTVGTDQEQPMPNVQPAQQTAWPNSPQPQQWPTNTASNAVPFKNLPQQ